MILLIVLLFYKMMVVVTSMMWPFHQVSKSPNQKYGSVVGNIFYNDGLVVITDTGSYSSVGTHNGSNGFTIKFNSSQTIYEREYICILMKMNFNIQQTKFKSWILVVV